MPQRALSTRNHDRTAEKQRPIPQRNYALGKSGIYNRKQVSVAESRRNCPDLYITADDRNKMGFAALLAYKGVQMNPNIGGCLFGSPHIDNLAKTLMGVLHGNSSLVLIL